MRCATEVPPALAVLATAQTGVGVVGASLFPLGLTVVVLLGGLLLMALPLYLAYRPAVDED